MFGVSGIPGGHKLEMKMVTIQNTPLVSVCVVTYNHEKYIEKCLQSVIDQQTTFNFELIVCDDCSTDGTWEIIEKLASKYPAIMKPYRHAKNIGARNNYVFAHRLAISEYVAHLDGDDYWMPTKLQEQAAFLVKHNECSAAYTNASVISKDSQVIGVFNRDIKNIFDGNYLLEKGNFLCHSSMMYRAKYGDEFLKTNGDFIDYHIHITLSELGAIGYLNEEFVAYRSDSTSSVIKVNNGYIRELYLNAMNVANRAKLSPIILNRSFAFFLTNAIYYELKYGKISRVRYWMKKIDDCNLESSFSLKIKSIISVFILIFWKIKNKLFPSAQLVFYPRKLG